MLLRDKILISLSSTEIVALTLYGEARGEPIEGQIAVGCVIRNRIGVSKTYANVCLEDYQFSCWNPDDPNYVILVELAKTIIFGSVENLVLNQCLWIATGIVDRVIMDTVHNSQNYLTTKAYMSGKVEWAANMKPTKVIGNHTFLSL